MKMYNVNAHCTHPPCAAPYPIPLLVIPAPGPSSAPKPRASKWKMPSLSTHAAPDEMTASFMNSSPKYFTCEKGKQYL